MAAVLMSYCGKFMYDEHSFSSVRSSSYSLEWLWGLRAKLCCIALGK